MRQDAVSLDTFYNTPLGELASDVMRERIDALWPSAAGRTVLGLGYVSPVLASVGGDATRCCVCSPSDQGPTHWKRSPNSGNASLLGDEARLPFRDQIFDRVVLLHALEEAAAPAAILREVWRVLAPEGRVLIIAANRRGLWARAESTPFGHGRPWTRGQLTRLLSDALFQTTAWTYALYTPPIPWTLSISLSPVFERSGESLRSVFGGAVMVEAVKRLYIDPAGGAPEASPLGVAKARKGIAGAPKDKAPDAGKMRRPSTELTRPAETETVRADKNKGSMR
ncbi:MAG: methyltransferase domain-containing protein [Pseudomonadota bacterium]